MREMKDSCVSWIGTVPSDWIRKKVKNAVSLIGSGTTPASSCLQYYESEDVNWIQSGDIYGIDTIIKTNTMISNAAVRSLSALHVYNPEVQLEILRFRRLRRVSIKRAVVFGQIIRMT